MNGEPTKVLLVEDNPGDARLLREALRDVRESQIELVHVERLEEALRCLREEPFKIILLDLSLPDSHGIETVVRVQGEVPTVPIVVLTGLDDDAVALEAVRAGAQDYLVKGQIEGRLLVRAIRYAIERKRAQEEIQRNLNRITALREISMATASALDLSTVLNILLKKIAALYPYAALGIRLLDKNGELRPTACWNLDEEEWKAEGGRISDFGLPALVLENNSPVAILSIQKDPRTRRPEFFRKHGLISYIGLPLIAKGKTIGVLSVYTQYEHNFGNEEISFLSTLANQTALTIHNSQVYEELKKLASDLERANHVKEEFLGVMSHELRTPLNVVKGYVEMLQSGFFGEINPDQQDVLKKLSTRTQDQLAMINSILHATTIESEVAKGQTDAVPLRDFLDELRTAYPPPLDKRVALQWRYSSELPVINTDGTKLRYILQNLINNAIKFTQEGAVTVSAKLLDSAHLFPEARESDKGKIWLTFEVADTGVGIAEEFLPMIFEKFSQVDSSTTRVHEGIGLGLHIVKRCTELLRGTIKVESQPGKGSTFAVTIPCEISEEGTFNGK